MTTQKTVYERVAEIEKALESLNDAFKETKKNFASLDDSLDEAVKKSDEYEDIATYIDDIGNAIKKVKSIADKASQNRDLDAAIKSLEIAGNIIKRNNDNLNITNKEIENFKSTLTDVVKQAEKIEPIKISTGNVGGEPVGSGDGYNPDPKNWKEYNAEVTKALDLIEKIRVETTGLSAEQDEELRELTASVRSAAAVIKKEYAGGIIPETEFNSVTVIKKTANAIKEENAEYQKLQKSLNSAAEKLEIFHVKNEKTIDSTEDSESHIKYLDKAFKKLQEDLYKIQDVDAFSEWKIEFEKFKRQVTETSKASREAAKEAKALALAEASEIATVAETIRAKIVDGLYNFAIKQIKAIFDAVADLDERLVEIRKVTDFSDSGLNTFVENIKNIGSATATTTSQLLEASAVFARSGYTQEQIEMLTEEAAVLKNVSDGITDMTEASQVLISVMKAYHVPAEQARDITDQLNIISNNAAISFDDLAEGISRIGSVFASQDTSIAQLSAMLTGANEILQNIEKTSNGLKTIAQRIRGIDADMSGDVLGTAKLQELFNQVIGKYEQTVDITDKATGQLRGTYDILKDLAGVWNQLTSNEQQLLGEKIAGKQQITVLQALLNNWESVSVAIENADDAAGSAAKEQEAMLRSLTGAINNLKAALQNMYAGGLPSDLLAGIVNILAGIVKFVDKIGIDVVAISAGVGAVAGKWEDVKSAIGNIKTIFDKISDRTKIEESRVEKFKLGVQVLTKGSQELAQSLLEQLDAEEQIAGLQKDETQQMHRLLKLAAEGNLTFTDRIAMSKLANKANDEQIRQLGTQLGLEKSINAAKAVALSLATATVSFLASKAIQGIGKIIDNARNALNNATKELEEAETKVKDLESQLESIYNDIESHNGQITKGQQEQITNLEKQLVLERAIAEERRRQQADVVNKGTGETWYPTGIGESGAGAYYREWDEETKKWIETTTEDINYFLDENNNLIKEKYDDAIKYISSHNIDTLKAVGDLADEEGQMVLEAYGNLENAIVEYIEEMNTIITNGVTEGSITDALRDIFAEFDSDKIEDFWNNIVQSADFSEAIGLTDKFGLSIDDLIKQFQKLNGTNVDKWQEEYSDIAAVERKLSEYTTLYTQAVNGTSNTDLINIIDNWEKYADVLDVENGQLVISKELIIAKAKDEIEEAKIKLTTERDKLAADIARAESELALRKTAAESAKGQVQDANMVIGAKKGIIAANNAIINGERGALQDIGKLNSQVNSLAKGANYAAYSTAQLEQAIANMRKHYASLNEQIAALDNINVEALLEKAAKAAKKGTKNTKAATKAVKELEDALKALKDVLSELERQMSDTTDVYEQIQAAMQEIIETEIAGIEAENDALDENMEYYRARIKLLIEAYEEQIAALEAEQEAAEAANQAQQDAIEAQIEALQEETEAYEEQIEAQKDAIDEQIEALKARQKAIDDAAKAEKEELDMEQRLLDIEKARLAVEKAKDAYEQAKNSKTVRTYDAERGWVWTANQQNVESAYNAYTSAQANYEKLLQDYFDKLAEMEREAEKAALQEEIDALEAQKDALDELLETAQENAKAEEEALKATLEALKEEQKAIEAGYQAQIDALQQQIDQLDSIESNVERAVDKYLNDQGVLDWVEAYLNASDEERAAMEEELAGIWQADREHQIANEEKIEELNDLLQQIADMLNVTNEILDSEGVKAWLEAFSNGDYDERADMIQEMRDAYLEFYDAQQAEIKKIQDQIAQLEGTLNYTNMLLENWGTGEGYTPVHHYANGGVVDSGLLSHTGMLSDYAKVHGNPGNPELILNGRQQANLLYRLAQMKPTPIGTTPSYTTESMYIANLTITADSQDTLRGLLLQAKQLASVS